MLGHKLWQVLADQLDTYDESHPRDRWGMEGGYWQTHRSGWFLQDFGEGWDTVCCENYHFVDQTGHLLEKPFGAIWAFRNLAGASGGATSMPVSLLARYFVRKLLDWRHT